MNQLPEAIRKAIAEKSHIRSFESAGFKETLESMSPDVQAWAEDLRLDIEAEMISGAQIALSSLPMQTEGREVYEAIPVEKELPNYDDLVIWIINKEEDYITKSVVGALEPYDGYKIVRDYSVDECERFETYTHWLRKVIPSVKETETVDETAIGFAQFILGNIYSIQYGKSRSKTMAELFTEYKNTLK